MDDRDHETEIRSALSGRRVSRRTAVQGAAALGLGATALSGALTTARAQEKVKIRLGTWAAVEEANELKAVIEKVNADAEDFEIVSEPQPADYYTKLQTTIAGSTGPDLFWLSQEYVPGYADLGAIMDISDMLEGDDTPAADLSDYFEPILKTAQYDGSTYGLPWISQPVMLYYNPKLFEDAGIDPPTEDWTWDDFKSAAEALTDADAGVYGTSFNSWPPIHMFIWQAGGETITPELDACPIDTPEAIEGAQFYADIIYKPEYAAPESAIAEQGFGEMMKAGKIGMFYGGATDDLDYAYKKDPKNAEIKMALVPSGPAGRTTFAWTASTVVNASTENPEMAYKALVALTEGIHHWKVVAPRKSLATEETIAEVVPDKAEAAPVIVQALEDMRSFNIIPEQAEWDLTFSEEYQTPLFFDEGTADELAPEVRPMLEDLLP
jgi:multiple sugar transport system substrate-binding protein